MSLAREGVHVVMNGRTQSSLDAAVAEVKQVAAGEVQAVCCDVTTQSGRSALLSACPQPDIVVNNAGGPPPGDFRDWTQDTWHSALNANMITPIEIIKATVDGMAARGFGRIVNITSSAVKAPVPPLGLSNGARAGLTGFVAGIAREMAGSGVTINAVLPGMFDTDRLRGNISNAAEKAGRSAAEEARQKAATIPMGRFGDPHEFGELCAYLCSRQAAFITGQNVLIDGGKFPGTL